MIGINKYKQPRELKLFLAKPTRQIISPIKHAYNKNIKIAEKESNELSFTLPYEVIHNHKKKKYKVIDLIKEKFLIKAVSGNDVEWFVISSFGKSSDEIDEMSVECFSLEHTIGKKKLIDFHVTSHNLLMVAEKVVENTGWQIGYINPEFNTKYREFDISSTTKLSFFYNDLTETFDAVVKFDTVNKTINYYKRDELSGYKGFSITERRYLESIEQKIDSNEIVTRLHVTGADGLGIQSVNPTGQRYIDDFSYYLYPFNMDDDGNVLEHSAFMEDDLAIALVNYNKYVSSRKDEFGNYLSKKSEEQVILSEEQNKLFELNTELQLILDSISWRKDEGLSVKELIQERDEKSAEIKDQENVISSIQDKIDKIDEDIKKLGEDLSIDKHLSSSQLEHLEEHYIHEDEWTDENKIDPNDLYEAGIEKLSEINSPPTDIKVNMVNFLEVVDAQHDWDRFNIGDIIRIKHKKLGIIVKARLVSIEIDYETPSIEVGISNLDELNDLQNKLKRAFYSIEKVNTDFNKRKINWNTVAENFNLRNDRIQEVPSDPIVSPNKAITHRENDNGSVDLTVRWDYPNYNETEDNHHNIDGFLVYMYNDVTDEPYQFTSQMAKETIMDVPFSMRTLTFPSLPSNLYYTVGIRAYRRVDEDINRDGILMSSIVRFNDAIGGFDGATVLNSRKTDFTLSDNKESNKTNKPYRPTKTTNIKGKLNGSSYTVNSTPPSEPDINDVWIDTIDNKTKIWNGSGWSVDSSLDDEVDRINKEMSNQERELRRRINESRNDVNQAMDHVDKEMDRIENEVVPEVEEAIKNTYIPRQDTPPDPVPPSNLWWDTSQDPEVLMRWDGVEWVNLAPSEDELQQIRDDVDTALTEVDNAVSNVNQEMDRLENDIMPEVNEAINTAKIPKQTTPPTELPSNELWWDTSQDPPRLMRWDSSIGDWKPVAATGEEIDGLIEDAKQEAVQESENYTDQIKEIIDQELLDKADLEYVDGQLQFKADSDLVNTINDTVDDLQLTTDDLLIDVADHDDELQAQGGRITTVETNIDTVEGNLSVAIRDLNLLEDEVSAQGTQISANAEAISFKADQEDLNTVTDDISDINSQLTIMAGDIEAKAERSALENLEDDVTSISNEVSSLTVAYDGISADVSSLESVTDAHTTYIGNLNSSFSVLSDEVSSKVSAEYVTGAIADIDIGGRNYALNSDELVEYKSNARFPYDVSDEIKNHPQTKFSVSFDMEYTGAEDVSRVEIYLYNGEFLSYAGGNSSGNRENTSIGGLKNDGNWARYEGTIYTVDDIGDKNNITIVVRVRKAGGGFSSEVRVKNMKVEKGNKATDWSSAPEDTQAEIDSVYSYAESEINQLADEIELKVDVDGISNAINLNNQGVQIDASKVDIAGLVEFINNDSSSSTLIDGGRIITSSITASQLNVGNIFGNSAVIAEIQSEAVTTANLSANQITAGTLNANNVSVINLSASNIVSGTLDASNINVENINASNITSGTLSASRIGASSITAGKLNISNIFGNSAVIAEIQSESVLTADLSATKITSGTLNAGNISVVNLSASSITSGTLDASKINVRNLSASSITTGTLRGLTVEGVDIIGSVFTQDSSNGRITLDNEGFTLLDKTHNEKIYIGINDLGGNNLGDYGIYFLDNNDTFIAGLSHYFTETILESDAELVLRGGDSGVHIDGSRHALSNYGVGVSGGLSIRDSSAYRHLTIQRDNSGSNNVSWQFGLPNGDLAIALGDVSSSSNRMLTIRNGVVRIRDKDGDLETGRIDMSQSGVTAGYLGVDTRLRVTDGSFWRGSNSSTNYKEVVASNFNTSSLVEKKQDIELMTTSALKIINNTDIYKYRLRSEVDNGNFKINYGVVIGEGYNTPFEILSSEGDSVSQYDMNSFSWKAIQELSDISEDHADRINYLEMENQYLKQKIMLLEDKL